MRRYKNCNKHETLSRNVFLIILENKIKGTNLFENVRLRLSQSQKTEYIFNKIERLLLKLTKIIQKLLGQLHSNQLIISYITQFWGSNMKGHVTLRGANIGKCCI